MADRPATDFGSHLKRARDQKGVSLRQIAGATKISVAALEALERNDISRLPGGIFSRGIVRSYAIEVGLDPERTVRDFIEQFPTDAVTAGSPHVPTEDHAAIESDRRSAETVLKLAGVSVPLGIAILYLTLAGRTSPGTSPSAVPPQGTVAPPVSRQLPSVTPSGGTHQPAAPGAVGRPLVLTVTSHRGAWVELTVDGARVVSRMVEPDEQVTVQAATSVVMAVGDAGAVTFTIDGRPGISLGPAGQARTVRLTHDTAAAFLARP